MSATAAGGRVAVLGVFNADLVFAGARLPRMGETLLGDAFEIGPGGKGSNQAVAAARAGADVAFLSRIGEDAFGELALATWRADGIDTASVIRDPHRPTGAAFIFVSSETGDNAILVGPGAAAALTPADMDSLGDTIRGASVFVTQLEQPMAAAERGLQIAREAGVMTILDPAPAAELPDAFLALADYVTPNEAEAAAITGLPVGTIGEAHAAAAALIARGAGAAVLTLGERGVVYHDGSDARHVPSVAAAKVVDTTGAGDAFNGAFAAALAEGRAPLEAIHFASAAASLSVSRPGASTAMPSREEIDTAMASEAA